LADIDEGLILEELFIKKFFPLLAKVILIIDSLLIKDSFIFFDY